MTFDGTIVEHEYPNIGLPVSNAIYYLNKFQELGIKLILRTVRDGKKLQEAVDYCSRYGFKFLGINENPEQFTSSPKPHHTLSIDDRNFDSPLIYSLDGTRPFVNWDIVGPSILKMMEI